ncbi:RagB/SusD family nutrient uptake outer membrane protein [Lutibacter sp. HS1-25]|uniref:RagB/SusD family nutrient uptake outer membrane protein n=1 Tax=Lutibacter sp. HS1-25 TaxID=2485000 RepID=UPI0010102192|nr:RagB/SusD family nutrient uptake outer membrane protein [Lutibacter sp. HS1-25]RXP44315.1 RagB/SusD family nutrient uptake outer membrane protein [Lutibacter sp. HS1-25]
MKKIITLICIAYLAIGCSDLEENPVGLLAPESFFQTTDDLQAAVNGSFAYMASEKYWGRKLSLALLLRGDMADIGDQTTSAYRIDVNNFTMNDDNAMVTNFWPQSYAIIGAANQAIDGAELLSGDQDKINAVAAQAYFARAFAYYNLVRLFGEIPYIDFAVSDISTVESISKSSVDAVYAGIVADLEFAKKWLPDTQPTRSLPSKATAAAYLASVYLTLGEHAKSYTEAKYVITNKGKFNVGLDPDYQNLFNADKVGSSNEPLFTIDFIGQSRDGDLGQDYLASVTGIRGNITFSYGEGWSVAVPSLKVYNDWDGRDYRKAVSLDTVATFKNVGLQPYTVFKNYNGRAVNRPHIAKYYRMIGIAGNNGRESSSNYITMRYAEVLLTAAEALNETTPGSSEAAGYVNEVRTRARLGGGTPSAYPANLASGLNQADLRKAILEERRIELAFEFGRWFDIKRLGIGNEAFGPNGFEPQPNFTASRDYLFPLPADELARNTNLQPNNPGY